MTLYEKKNTLRYLLKSIFFDECEDIGDEDIIRFYLFLMDGLEAISDAYASKNKDDFFAVESVVQALANFPEMDTSFLFFIIKNPENFREVVSEQTGFPQNVVDEYMERLLNDFQDIKQAFLSKA